MLTFTSEERDKINEETVEFLEPYLTLKFPDPPLQGELVYTGDVAKVANSALSGLTIWARAMSQYYQASKIVRPKLTMLEQKKIELKSAQDMLNEKEAELEAVNKKKQELKARYDKEMAEKTILMERA